jgi:hypothetical protein
MIRKAMSCDVCNKVQVLEDADLENLRYEAPIPEGWIRIVVNNPKRFSFSETPQVAIREDLDVCSISCATTRLFSYTESE